jgi:hypothetical protein
MDIGHKHHLCVQSTQVHWLRSLQRVHIRPGRTRVDILHHSQVCVQCTLTATYANGCGRFNACTPMHLMDGVRTSYCRHVTGSCMRVRPGRTNQGAHKILFAPMDICCTRRHDGHTHPPCARCVHQCLYRLQTTASRRGALARACASRTHKPGCTANIGQAYTYIMHAKE